MTIRGVGLTHAAVGVRCSNQRDDVETIQRLLNLCAADNRVKLDQGQLKPDGAFGKKTLNAIIAFQHSEAAMQNSNGQIDPDSETLFSLCESLPSTLDSDLLAMLYLRADSNDVAELVDTVIHVNPHAMQD